ncbi:molybdopterin molybdotransferase MoeA [Aurantivibrio plasticivorans]
MDCCSQPGLMPLAQALDQLRNTITPISDVETIAIEHARNRILARTITSSIAVPGFDNSAMDGYAFRFNDIHTHASLQVVGKSFAGTPYKGNVSSGQCVRIMTGAVLPAGCDTVVMQENVDSQEVNNEAHISLNHPPKSCGAHVRYAGEDFQIGDELLSTGKRLTSRDLCLLSSVGIAEVTVYRRLKAAVFSTGDELKRAGEPLSSGDIFDSNRILIGQMLESLNVDVIDFGIIPDDLTALEACFQNALNEADFIVTSGGVSVGEADYTKIILDKLGDIDFWKVAIKPGKPFAFGTLKNSQGRDVYFYGLPGNPVSSNVTLHQIGVPAIRQHAGESPENIHAPVTLSAIATRTFKSGQGRIDFQRALLSQSPSGQWQVGSAGNQSSAAMLSMSRANCYVIFDSCSEGCSEGDEVTVQPFDQWLM